MLRWCALTRVASEWSTAASPYFEKRMDFIPTIEDEESTPASQSWDEESEDDTEEETEMVLQ